jgi:hypothetical protein
MKRIALPIFIVALLGALAFWWFSPVQVLKRRTVTLLETLTLPPGSGNSGRQLGVYSLNALLANEVELVTETIPEANGSFDRSELESGFSWLCSQSKQTRFELLHVESVTVNGDKGVVRCDLQGLVELSSRRPVDGRFDVTFEWVRGDDGWRLERATWEEQAE